MSPQALWNVLSSARAQAASASRQCSHRRRLLRRSLPPRTPTSPLEPGQAWCTGDQGRRVPSYRQPAPHARHLPALNQPQRQAPHRHLHPRRRLQSVVEEHPLAHGAGVRTRWVPGVQRRLPARTQEPVSSGRLRHLRGTRMGVGERRSAMVATWAAWYLPESQRAETSPRRSRSVAATGAPNHSRNERLQRAWCRPRSPRRARRFR